MLVDDIAERLAAPLDAAVLTAAAPGLPAPAASEVPDHLRVWSALRQTIFWEQAASPQEPGSSASAGASVSASAHAPAPGRDVAAEDVKAFEGAIDPARAGGLSVPAGDPRDALWLVRNLHMVPWDAK